MGRIYLISILLNVLNDLGISYNNGTIVCSCLLTLSSNSRHGLKRTTCFAIQECKEHIVRRKGNSSQYTDSAQWNLDMRPKRLEKFVRYNEVSLNRVSFFICFTSSGVKKIVRSTEDFEFVR